MASITTSSPKAVPLPDGRRMLVIDCAMDADYVLGAETINASASIGEVEFVAGIVAHDNDAFRLSHDTANSTLASGIVAISSSDLGAGTATADNTDMSAVAFTLTLIGKQRIGS